MDNDVFFLDMLNVFNHVDVELLIASRAKLGSGWRNANNADPFTRLYLIHDGEAFVEHHGICYRMRSGGFYVIPAHTVVSFHCPEFFEVSWIHFNATLSGGMDFFQWLPGSYGWEVDDFSKVASYFEEVVALRESRRWGDMLHLKGVLLQLLALYVKEVDQSLVSRRLTSGYRFKNVLEYIERTLPAPIRINILAKIACLESTYFATCFKESFGLSPRAYILSKRIELARYHLIDSDMGLGEIALKCGFCDSYHLSRTFKKLVGVPPGEFRRRNADEILP